MPPRFHPPPPQDHYLYESTIPATGGLTIYVNGIPLYVGDVGPGGTSDFFVFMMMLFGFFVWFQRRLAASLPQYPGNRRPTTTTGRGAGSNHGAFHMPGPDRGPPPAKPYLLDELPLIKLEEDDLVVRTSCAVCTCDFAVGDEVRRLPCAHVYHDECLASWLVRRCTCPTCRWELPTDDQNYEPGRQQRMATRRPRFFRFELDHRLTIRQLKTLLRTSAPPNTSSPSSTYQPVERDDLIRHLIETGSVELIPFTGKNSEENSQGYEDASHSEDTKSSSDSIINRSSSFLQRKAGKDKCE